MAQGTDLKDLRLKPQPDVNRDNVRAWVDALRSGKYPQGDGQLARKSDSGRYSYCCLGVACEIAGVAKMEHTSFPWNNGVVGKTYDKEDAVLPPSVQEWLGITDGNPDLERDGERPPRPIAQVNDNGATFDQIADLIERSWL